MTPDVGKEILRIIILFSFPKKFEVVMSDKKGKSFDLYGNNIKWCEFDHTVPKQLYCSGYSLSCLMWASQMLSSLGW